MADKIAFLGLYVLFGLLLGLTPLFIPLPQRASEARSEAGRFAADDSWWFVALYSVATFAILTQSHLLASGPLMLVLVAVSLAVVILYRGSNTRAAQTGAATLLACAASATLPYWFQAGNLGSPNKELFVLAPLWIAGTSLLLRHKVSATGGTGRVLMIGLYCAAAAYLSFAFAWLSFPRAWQNWGAYIGPSESVLAGARLFYDIPAQYGAGPTLLLALACGTDCWSHAYWVFCTACFVYTVVIGMLIFSMRTGDRYRDALLLATCFVACTFWISFPMSTVTPVEYPSTGGMRFLPVVALAAWLLLAGRLGARTHTLGSYLLWIVGVFWSPESAFFVTLTWWPIYLFDRRSAGDLKARFSSVMRGSTVLLGLAAGTAVAVALVYRIAYGVFPSLSSIFAYMLYPPVVLHEQPQQTIWFFLFAMALAVCVSYVNWFRGSDLAVFRRSLLIQLMALSAFAYYIGRSNNNNILNLMPFLLLLLCDTLLGAARQPVARAASAVCLASILVWTVAFNWAPGWRVLREGRIADFDINAAVDRFNYRAVAAIEKSRRNPNAVTLRELDDAGKLMEIAHTRGEPFVILDDSYNLQRIYPDNAWSAINGPANFAFLPSSMRREFLLLTAQRLGRDGWVIVSRNFDASSWISDFDSVYQRTNRIDLDTYYAIRYAWRPSMGLAVPQHD